MMADWYIKLDTRAWLGDQALAGCSIEAKGVWIYLICAMAQNGDRYGFAETDGKAWSVEKIARLCGCSVEVASAACDELVTEKVAGRDTRTNALFSRRLIRDMEERRNAAKRKRKSRGGCHGDVTDDVTPVSHKCHGDVTPLSQHNPQPPPTAHSQSELQPTRTYNGVSANGPPIVGSAALEPWAVGGKGTPRTAFDALRVCGVSERMAHALVEQIPSLDPPGIARDFNDICQTKRLRNKAGALVGRLCKHAGIEVPRFGGKIDREYEAVMDEIEARRAALRGGYDPVTYEGDVA